MVLIFSFIGGLLSRMHGGGKPHLPFSLDAWLYAVPYGAIAFLALLSTAGTIWEPYPYWIWLGAIMAYLGAVLGKRTGHGGWMDLGTWKKVRKDERLEFLIKPIKGKLSNYWYDVIGLCLTGVAVTLACGVCVAFVDSLLGGFIILSGLSKGLAYMIGWKIGKYPTEIGEWLTGIFGWASCYVVLQALLGVHFG